MIITSSYGFIISFAFAIHTACSFSFQPESPIFFQENLTFEGLIYPYELYKIGQQMLEMWGNSSRGEYMLKLVEIGSEANQQRLKILMENLPEFVGFQVENEDQDINIRIVNGKYLVIENMTRDSNSQSLQQAQTSDAQNKTVDIGQGLKNIFVYEMDPNLFAYECIEENITLNWPQFIKQNTQNNKCLNKLLKYQIKQSVHPTRDIYLWDVAFNASSFKIITFQQSPDSLQPTTQPPLQPVTDPSQQMYPYKVPSLPHKYILTMDERTNIQIEEHRLKYQLVIEEGVSVQQRITFLSLISDIFSGSYFLLLGNEVQFSIFEVTQNQLQLKGINRFINHNLNIYQPQSPQIENPHHYITVNDRKVNRFNPILHIDKFKGDGIEYFGVILNQSEIAILGVNKEGDIQKKCQRVLNRDKLTNAENISEEIISVNKIGQKYLGACFQQSSIIQHYNTTYKVVCRVIDTSCDIRHQQGFPTKYQIPQIKWSYSYDYLFPVGNLTVQSCKETLTLLIKYQSTTDQFLFYDSCFSLPSNQTINQSLNATDTLSQLNQQYLQSLENTIWFYPDLLTDKSLFQYRYIDSMMSTHISGTIPKSLELSKQDLINYPYAQINTSLTEDSECVIDFKDDSGLMTNTSDYVEGSVTFQKNWRVCKIFLTTLRATVVLKLSDESREQYEDSEITLREQYELYECATDFTSNNPKCRFDSNHDIESSPLFLRVRSPNLIYILNKGNLTDTFTLNLIDINSEEIKSVMRVSYLMLTFFVGFILSILIFMGLKRIITLVLIYFNIVSPNNIRFTYPLGYWELKIKLNKMVNDKIIKFVICDKHRIEEDCCFCLQGMGEEKYLAQFYCRHFFHRSCVQEWIKQESGSLNCPMCKRKLVKSGQEAFENEGVQIENNEFEQF